MFRNILVGVDGTSHGRDAVALATILADPGARLTLAHVQPGVRPDEASERGPAAGDPTYYAGGRVESRELLEAERAATGVVAELITVAGPAVGPALHALADELAADLLVVGACKHRLAGRILIGDDTRASVDGARCPVAIAPPGYGAAPTPPTTIGVGFDFSPESEAALAAARELAARHTAKLTALDVVAGRPIGGYLSHFAGDRNEVLDRDRRLAHERLQSLDDVEARAVSGDPCRTLADFADQVDLFVVGSRSQGRLRHLLSGSTSRRLALHVHSPMLVVPPTGVLETEHPHATLAASSAGPGSTPADPQRKE